MVKQCTLSFFAFLLMGNAWHHLQFTSLNLYDTGTQCGPPEAIYGCTGSGWMHDTVYKQ